MPTTPTAGLRAHPSSSRWSAARAYIFEHVDPYGLTITQRVQSFAYGREAYLNEYPYVLNDPFYIVLYEIIEQHIINNKPVERLILKFGKR